MRAAASESGEIDQALTELAHAQMPLTGLLGLGIVGGGPDEIRARCSWAPVTRTTQTQAVIVPS